MFSVGDDGLLGWTEYIAYFVIAWAALIAVTEPEGNDERQNH